jgi:hypothetical protein
VADTFSRFFRQCSKKRGFGRDGLFCKQHARRAGFVPQDEPSPSVPRNTLGEGGQ